MLLLLLLIAARPRIILGEEKTDLPLIIGNGNGLKLFLPNVAHFPLVQRRCQAGKKYVVTSLADLVSHAGEYECLFNAGIGPIAPPLGVFPGGLLEAWDSHAFNQIATIWDSYVINATNCVEGQPEIILGYCTLHHSPFPWVPFLASVTADPSVVLADGEHFNGKPALEANFNSFSKLFGQCPAYVESLVEAYGLAGVAATVATMQGIAPLIIDLSRYVGTLGDEGRDIYIAKSYFTSPWSGKARTVFFFYFFSDDKSATPGYGSRDIVNDEDFLYLVPSLPSLVG